MCVSNQGTFLKLAKLDKLIVKYNFYSTQYMCTFII